MSARACACAGEHLTLVRARGGWQADNADAQNEDLFELLLHDLDRDHDGQITLTEFLEDFERE